MTLIAYKKADSVNPKKQLIFSQPKVGKTSLVAQLPNSLIIDCENGTNFIDGYKINVLEIMKLEKKSAWTVLNDIANELIEDIKTSNKKKFDFIVFDTVTALEEQARKLATEIYKTTNIGKNFTGYDVVSQLPSGGGYEFLRQAFMKMYNLFDGLSNKGLVLLGHFKKSSITKEGKELDAKDIALSGKLKLMVSADVDAVGFLYRNKETNQNILSYKTQETDLITGARPPHLRGKEFVISEIINNELITYWDNIYLNLKKEN